MDVRCGLCGTEYDFDDALISERGTTVQCTECGFQFKVYPEQPLSGLERWFVRSGSGAGWEREYTSLKDLQLAIRQGDIGPADLLFRGTSEPRPLASIAELEPLFRQRLVRSGGTLLGMMPVPGSGNASDIEPPSSVPVATAGRRVATKLGLPAPPLPDSTRHGAPPVPPSGPPPVAPRSSEPTSELTETSPSGAQSGAPDTAHFSKTLPSATRPPELDRIDQEPPQRSETRAREQHPVNPGSAKPEPVAGERSALARTLPSAVTPNPSASPVGARQEERSQAHSSAPRQRIVSLLSVSDEPASPVGRAERAWATQTLPSALDGVERPSPEQLVPKESVSPPSAPRGSEAPPPVSSASPASSALPASSAPPASSVPASAPVPALPTRSGGARWAIGALVLAAGGAAALWGWSRGDGVSSEPEGAEPHLAAAETVPPEVPTPEVVEREEEATPDPATTSASPDAPPVDAAPEVRPARRTSQEPSDYRTRLSGANRAAQSGDVDRAARLYESVLQDQPGNVEALAGLAEVAQRRGQTQTSAELYERALASSPSYAPALVGRGDQLWAAGQRAAAVQLYRRVVEQLGPTGTYGKRAQSRITEASEMNALPSPEGDVLPAQGPATPSAEPTSQPVDDTKADE